MYGANVDQLLVNVSALIAKNKNSDPNKPVDKLMDIKRRLEVLVVFALLFMITIIIHIIHIYYYYALTIIIIMHLL